MISFWGNLINTFDSNTLSSHIYSLAYTNGLEWSTFIGCILDECGLSYVWIEQNSTNIQWLRTVVHQISNDKSNVCNHGQQICILHLNTKLKN